MIIFISIQLAQVRAANRELKQSGRELDRELMNLKRQEQQIMVEIQKALKSHQEATARTLAKTLIQNRKQQERFLKTKVLKLQIFIHIY